MGEVVRRSSRDVLGDLGTGRHHHPPRLIALLRRGIWSSIGRGDHLELFDVENRSQGLIPAALAPAAAGQVDHMTEGEELMARSAFYAPAVALGGAAAVFLAFFDRLRWPQALEWGPGSRKGTTPPGLTRYGVRLTPATAAMTSAKRKTNWGVCRS